MTGLDDGQRADFRLMGKNSFYQWLIFFYMKWRGFYSLFAAEVAKTTRTAPPERVAALQKFSTRLKGLKEVDDELAKWDLKFGNVCQFKGMYNNVHIQLAFVYMKPLFVYMKPLFVYITEPIFVSFRTNFTARTIDFWTQE